MLDSQVWYKHVLAGPQGSFGHTRSADLEGPMWLVGEYRQAGVQRSNVQDSIVSNGLAEILGKWEHSFLQFQ